MKELLPQAVREAGDVAFNNGEKIENILMVDKVWFEQESGDVFLDCSFHVWCYE